VLLKPKARNARHCGHTVRGFINNFEATVVEGVYVFVVLFRAIHLCCEVSSLLDVSEPGLQDLPKVGLNAETRLILVLDHMMSFAFKNGFVVVTSSLPILNEKLINAW
jgi:hypothetical protein